MGLILGLLLINSSIAYWEESQAGNAIAALKAQLTPKATAKRDGVWKVIDAAELVPGGILMRKRKEDGRLEEDGRGEGGWKRRRRMEEEKEDGRGVLCLESFF
jgi:hypothetical protein